MKYLVAALLLGSLACAPAYKRLETIPSVVERNGIIRVVTKDGVCYTDKRKERIEVALCDGNETGESPDTIHFYFRSRNVTINMRIVEILPEDFQAFGQVGVDFLIRRRSPIGKYFEDAYKRLLADFNKGRGSGVPVAFSH